MPPEGSAKVLLPRARSRLEGVLINIIKPIFVS